MRCAVIACACKAAQLRAAAKAEQESLAAEATARAEQERLAAEAAAKAEQERMGAETAAAKEGYEKALRSMAEEKKKQDSAALQLLATWHTHAIETRFGCFTTLCFPFSLIWSSSFLYSLQLLHGIHGLRLLHV